MIPPGIGPEAVSEGVIIAFRILVLFLAITIAAAAAPVTSQEPVDTPREVKIGILLADLIDVKGADQMFSADVYLLATWHDPALVNGAEEIRTLDLDDVWHPMLIITNARSVSESMPSRVMVQPDGTVNYLQRYTGQFSARMNLREFPADRQEFYVWVVSPAVQGINITLTPDDSLKALRVEELSISDWEIGEPALEEKAFQVAPGGIKNPGIKLTIPARRRVMYYAIQILIPLIAIVMMSYAVFWIGPAVVPTRVGVVVTTMLTLIAYRFMLGNHVPRLSYLTRLDWFMLGATVLVILTLFTMAGTSYLVYREKEAIVKKIDRTARVLYPVAFALYSLIVWLS